MRIWSLPGRATLGAARAFYEPASWASRRLCDARHAATLRTRRRRWRVALAGGAFFIDHRTAVASTDVVNVAGRGTTRARRAGRRSAPSLGVHGEVRIVDVY